MHWSRWGDPAEAGPLAPSAHDLVDAFIGTTDTPAVDPADVRLSAPLAEDLLADLMTREWGVVVEQAVGADADPTAGPGANHGARSRISRGIVATVRALRENALLRRIIDVDPEVLVSAGSGAAAARSSFRRSFSTRASAREADFRCAFASLFHRSARSSAFANCFSVLVSWPRRVVRPFSSFFCFASDFSIARFFLLFTCRPS